MTLELTHIVVLSSDLFVTEHLVTFFFFLATLLSIWGLNSLTRNQTHDACSGSVES